MIDVTADSCGDLLSPSAERLVGSTAGLVRSLRCRTPTETSPPIYLSYPRTADIERFVPGMTEPITAGGKGVTLRESLHSAIGEAVERYVLQWPERADLRLATYDSLRRSGERVVDYDYLDFFDAENVPHVEPLSRRDEIRWCSGTDLRTGAKTYVPAQMVYMTPIEDERVFFGSSNGTAVGESIEESLVRALYEVVERHCLLKTWYARRVPPRIHLDGRSRLRRQKEYLEGDHLQFHLFYLGTVAGVTSVGCAITNENDEDPAFCIAGGASERVDEAVEGAMVEGAQLWNQLVRRYERGTVGDEVDGDATSMLTRTIDYYSKRENGESVEFLFEGETIDVAELRRETQDDDAETDRGDRFRTCVGNLRDAGLTPLAFDLTTPDVGRAGLSAARVCVPELLPFVPPTTPPQKHPAYDGVNEEPHPLG